MIEIIDQNGAIEPVNHRNTTIERSMMACYGALLSERSNATAKTYKNGWKAFLVFLSRFGITKDDETIRLHPQLFIDFPEWLSRTKTQPTVRVYFAGMMYWMEWLIIHNYISPTPQEMLNLDKAKEHAIQKVNRPETIELDYEAIEAVLKTVHSLDTESPMLERNVAILAFLSSSGVRNAEACGLRIGDLDLRSRKARVLGKGKKKRSVKFSVETYSALKDYWQARGWGIDKKDPVFARHDDKAGKTEHGVTKLHEPITTTTLRRIVAAVANAAGVDVHPHLLRHWFATKMYQKSKDLRMVQKALGHANSKTTEIYAEPDMTAFEREHDEAFGNKTKDDEVSSEQD